MASRNTYLRQDRKLKAAQRLVKAAGSYVSPAIEADDIPLSHIQQPRPKDLGRARDPRPHDGPAREQSDLPANRHFGSAGWDVR